MLYVFFNGPGVSLVVASILLFVLPRDVANEQLDADTHWGIFAQLEAGFAAIP